jgi:WD40 repeat protein
VAAPTQKDGFVQVSSFEKAENTFTHLNDMEFKAHDGPVVCLAINQDGTLLATASDKVSKHHTNYLLVLCFREQNLGFSTY